VGGTGLRYLALGDSYTIGEGVPAAGRWPVQLVDALQARGIDIQAPQIIATSGWTTDELDAAIDAAAPVGDYDLVSLGIGVNNQYRGRPLDEYAAQFAALLERAIGFAGGDPGRVLVLSIPDWGHTPFAKAQQRDGAGTSARIDAFNEAARALCERRRVAFVDITPISRLHGMDPAMLADDGLHPSAAMYALWTRLACPLARDALA
jgi:lysophospholipase L1-like esterase